MTNAATTITTHCSRCGRLLSDPKAVARKLGRTCARKVAEAAKAAALTQPADRVAKATEALTEGAVAHRIHNLYLVVSTDGHTTYDVDLGTGGCTCRAGQFGRHCWHLTAASVLAAA